MWWGLIIIGIPVIVIIVLWGPNGNDQYKKSNPLEKLENKGFHVDKKITISNTQVFLVDDSANEIAVTSDEEVVVTKYEDIISYELNEDGNSIAQGKGVATAVGGLAFGALGALVGASGARKIQNTCSSLDVNVMVNNLNYPLVNMKFIGSETHKNATRYQDAKERAQEAIATLSYITNKMKRVQ